MKIDNGKLKIIGIAFGDDSNHFAEYTAIFKFQYSAPFCIIYVGAGVPDGPRGRGDRFAETMGETVTGRATNGRPYCVE